MSFKDYDVIGCQIQSILKILTEKNGIYIHQFIVVYVFLEVSFVSIHAIKFYDF